jgi:hypothetical protein
MSVVFVLGTSVSSTNKTVRHDKTEVLLNLALNTTILAPNPFDEIYWLRSCNAHVYYLYHLQDIIEHICRGKHA